MKNWTACKQQEIDEMLFDDAVEIVEKYITSEDTLDGHKPRSYMIKALEIMLQAAKSQVEMYQKINSDSFIINVVNERRNHLASIEFQNGSLIENNDGYILDDVDGNVINDIHYTVYRVVLRNEKLADVSNEHLLEELRNRMSEE